jgi:hypothetical protein
MFRKTYIMNCTLAVGCHVEAYPILNASTDESGMFETFQDGAGFFITYSELSRRSTDDILRNSVWEVLLGR